MKLTDKQLAFLQHIESCGGWTSFREIMDHFGFKSPNSVTQLLHAMQKKGLMDGKVITDKGYEVMNQYEKQPIKVFQNGETQVTKNYQYITETS